MERSFLDGRVTLHLGDCLDVLRTMPDQSVNCVVTSPPYFGLRDYGVAGQIGLEGTPAAFVAKMIEVFREVRRVLRDDGTCWVNVGDSYGSKKQKLLIPARVALGLQDDGWTLRQDNVWSKKRPMPESVRDRSTCAHEFVFHFSKGGDYQYDAAAVRQPGALSSVARLVQNVVNQTGSTRVPGKSNGTMKAVGGTDKQRGHTRRHAGFNDRWDALPNDEQQAFGANLRSVWHLAPPNFTEAHFATMPVELAERCILAGCPKGGVVLDPFGGAGTTALVALRHGRRAELIELNPKYADIAQRRIEREWRVPERAVDPDFGPLFMGAA